MVDIEFFRRPTYVDRPTRRQESGRIQEGHHPPQYFVRGGDECEYIHEGHGIGVLNSIYEEPAHDLQDG